MKWPTEYATGWIAWARDGGTVWVTMPGPEHKSEVKA